MTTRSSGPRASRRAATSASTVGGMSQILGRRHRHPAVAIPAHGAGLDEHEVICSTYSGIALGGRRGSARGRTRRGRRADGRRSNRPRPRTAARARSATASCVCRPLGARLERARGGRRPRIRIGAPRTASSEVIDQLQERRCRDMDVVDDGDKRPAAGDRLEQLADPPEQLRPRELRGGQSDRCGDPVGHGERVVRVAGDAPGDACDLVERLLEGILVVDAGGAPDDLGERPERDTVAVGQAAAAQHLAPFPGRGAAHELADQARLADARLADDRQQLRTTASSPTSSRAVSRRSISAARPTNGVVTESRSARGAADGDQPERGDGLGLALERQRRDGLDLDLVAREAVGQGPEDDLAGTRRLLEPRRRVDRVAGDQPLPGAGVAGDDLAGVDADVVAQLDAPGRAELVR